jgi:hypothetical protein
MSVNYDDERFTEVESQKSAALKDLDKTYDDMVDSSQKGYNDQIQASKDWVDKQTEIQNENTDFAIEQINQQKDQTKKDYLKEQSGAYKDWQKQSNKYGAEAERQASMGMANSGYSESSQVAMYNNYQNRVAAAREVYSRAVLNFDNKITEAKLQNNALLAEIAYEGLREQLALGIEAMQYKNSLLIQKSSEKRAINTDYYNRWKDVLSQINTENAQAEQKRQFDANMAFQREQFEWQKAQATAKASSAISSSKKSSGSASSSISKSTSDNTPKVKSKDELKVDMTSVLNLGYGPINAARLNSLVKTGEVQEIVDPIKGVITYKKSNPSLTYNTYVSKYGAPTLNK